MPKPIDITGQKFNRLTAIKYIHTNNKNQFWLFKCECGNEKIIRKSNVINGITKSCGCLNREIITTHQQTKNPLFRIWINIKQRCFDEKNKSYKNYGARGITMSDEWKNSFFIFQKDIGPRPSKKYSIDRINNNEGYSKDNCRWSTMSRQCRNTRRSVFFSYDGKKKNLHDICDDLELNYKIIHNRIKKLGWSLEKALKTPRCKSKIRKDFR